MPPAITKATPAITPAIMTAMTHAYTPDARLTWFYGFFETGGVLRAFAPQEVAEIAVRSKLHYDVYGAWMKCGREYAVIYAIEPWVLRYTRYA